MAHPTFEERQGRGFLLHIAIPGYLSEQFRSNLISAFEEHDYAPHPVADWSDQDALERFVDSAIEGGPYGRNVAALNSLCLISGVRGFMLDVLGFRRSELFTDDNEEETMGYIREVLETYPAEGQQESVINFVDYFLANTPAEFGNEICDAIERVFINNPTAYAVVRTQDTSGLPIREIHPALDDHSARLMGEEISRIAESSAVGARTYLSKAAKYLLDGDEIAGVRESWLAVEAAAQQLTGKPDQRLDRALHEIRREGLIPNSFISKLFCTTASQFDDYANKYPGLRHASSNAIPLDMDMWQARFFHGQSVNLVGYLIPYLDNPNKDNEETATDDNPELQ